MDTGQSLDTFLVVPAEKDAAQHQHCTGQLPTQKTGPAQNVTSLEAETLCSKQKDVSCSPLWSCILWAGGKTRQRAATILQGDEGLNWDRIEWTNVSDMEERELTEGRLPHPLP